MSPTQKRFSTTVALILLAYWSLIFVVNHIPLGGISQRFRVVPHLDKGVHFAMYAIFAFLLMWFFCGSGAARRSMYLLTACFLAVYGAIDEIIQLWIPSRNMDFYDWCADLGGTLGGLLAYHLVKSKWDQLAIHRVHVPAESQRAA